MYLLLERGHKGSSILSSLFCVLGWPGLPLWWPQDVALVSCCVFCFRFFFFFFVSYLTKVFLTLFLEVFLLLVFEIFSLFIWGLCVNFVLLLKFFFFLCCCLTLCCCCCDKPKGAKRHDDDDVLISLSSLFTRWRHAACVPPRFISIPKCDWPNKERKERKWQEKLKLSKEILLALGFLFFKALSSQLGQLCWVNWACSSSK